MSTNLTPKENFATRQPFDAIIELHWSRIFRFVLASIRDRELAEDLTQDCFWRASQGWTAFRGDSSVNTWLRHIALNVIRNFVRKRGLQLVRCAPSIETMDQDSLMDKSSPCPEATTVLRDAVQAIWKAAEGVSPKQRLALQLRFKQDLEVCEIATEMGISEGAVKIHLFRAVRAIRVTLHAL